MRRFMQLFEYSLPDSLLGYSNSSSFQNFYHILLKLSASAIRMKAA